MPVNLGKTLAYPTSVGDIHRDLRPVTGIDALVQSLFRRFETREGTIPWARGDGYRLLDLILDNEPDPHAIRARCEAECRKDDRVETVQATVVWNRRTRELLVHIEGTSGLGPFKFVVQVQDVSVQLLRS